MEPVENNNKNKPVDDDSSRLSIRKIILAVLIPVLSYKILDRMAKSKQRHYKHYYNTLKDHQSSVKITRRLTTTKPELITTQFHIVKTTKRPDLKTTKRPVIKTTKKPIITTSKTITRTITTTQKISTVVQDKVPIISTNDSNTVLFLKKQKF